MTDPATSSLENIVAINLRHKYGEDCYFYNTPKTEVDFYVPDQGMAIQVSYTIADEETRKREVNGLVAISHTLNVDNLLIVTKDEELEIESEGKIIHVMPLWKWLLNM